MTIMIMTTAANSIHGQRRPKSAFFEYFLAVLNSLLQ